MFGIQDAIKAVPAYSEMRIALFPLGWLNLPALVTRYKFIGKMLSHLISISSLEDRRFSAS